MIGYRRPLCTSRRIQRILEIITIALATATVASFYLAFSLETSNPARKEAANVSRQYNLDGRSPLLTLLTATQKYAKLERFSDLTLAIWGQLTPNVVPVLFTDSAVLDKRARDLGWMAMKPVQEGSLHPPLLKPLFMEAMGRFETPLYAYADGDLLFTESLEVTLKAILTSRFFRESKKHLLVVGRTTEGVSTMNHKSFKLPKRRRQNLTGLPTPNDVDRKAMTGKVLEEDFMGYFITDRNFPWRHYFHMRFERGKFGRWLVLDAIRRGHVVVDATDTLLAFRPVASSEDNRTAVSSSQDSTNILSRIYSGTIPLESGRIECAPLRTRRSGPKHARVVAVSIFPVYCEYSSRLMRGVAETTLFAESFFISFVCSFTMGLMFFLMFKRQLFRLLDSLGL